MALRSFFGCALAVLLSGCVTDKGLSVIDSAEAQKGTWAKQRQYFLTSEHPLIRIHGYGGHHVKVELREVDRGLVGTVSTNIPAASMQRAGSKRTFTDHFGQIVPAEQEQLVVTRRDWLIPLRPLPKGKYRVEWTVDGNKQQTKSFEVREAGL